MALSDIAQAYNLPVTVLGATGSAATLTLPAGGAGLFHYIGVIGIERTATAAVAGTAKLDITTTNFDTGNLMAWSVGNAIAIGATQIDLLLTPAFPIKSFAANTSTTIVMPAAGTGVFWRAYAWYFLAP